MTAFIRKFHRWAAWLFIVSVVVVSVAMTQEKPITWITYTPFLPLALLALSGITMLLLPYFRKNPAAPASG